MAGGPVAIRGCVAPLIFPGAKSTVLASSLIKVTWMSKEGIWGILSELSACASPQGGSQILHFSSFEHTWHGISLLPLKLSVTCNVPWPTRCEQTQHWSLLAEALRIRVWFTCSLSPPQWEPKKTGSFYQPGSPDEQSTHYITHGAWARDKLWLAKSLVLGSSLLLKHNLVTTDRYSGPVHAASWQPPTSNSASPPAFRFPLCFSSPLGATECT